MGASAAAAIIVKREKDLVEHFRSAGATTAQTAQSPSALGVDDDNLVWRLLVKGAVIRQAAGGDYYLDEPSWEALGRRRRRVAIGLAVFAIILALVTYFGMTRIAGQIH
jgi:hypothetical protein